MLPDRTCPARHTFSKLFPPKRTSIISQWEVLLPVTRALGNTECVCCGGSRPTLGGKAGLLFKGKVKCEQGPASRHSGGPRPALCTLSPSSISTELTALLVRPLSCHRDPHASSRAVFPVPLPSDAPFSLPAASVPITLGPLPCFVVPAKPSPQLCPSWGPSPQWKGNFMTTGSTFFQLFLPTLSPVPRTCRHGRCCPGVVGRMQGGPRLSTTRLSRRWWQVQTRLSELFWGAENAPSPYGSESVRREDLGDSSQLTL